MSEGYRIASLDEIELPQLVNSPRWSMIRRHFGIESFGINAWRAADAGQDVIAEHDEVSGGFPGRHEEIYMVLDGKAEFTVDGETFDATPGAVVFVRDPATKRRAVAAEPGTRILAVGGRRSEPFEVMPWERSAPAFPYFASGQHDKAMEVLEEALAEFPDDPTVLYNLACAESMVGRKAEAIGHLRRAIELGDRFKELAAKDTDFDPIRDEPEFQALVGD
jgi:tetratricopeptide (TPR) repeat protein